MLCYAHQTLFFPAPNKRNWLRKTNTVATYWIAENTVRIYITTVLKISHTKKATFPVFNNYFDKHNDD